MTATEFDTNSVHAIKLWSKRLGYDAISDETELGVMVKDGILTKQDDLSRGAGDQIKYSFLARLSNAGFIGNQAVTGNEVQNVYHQDTVDINQLRNVVQVPNDGTIDAQRVNFPLTENSYKNLKNWLTERMFVGAVNQLAGNTATTITYDGISYTGTTLPAITGMNAARAPSGTGRKFYGGTGNTTDEGVNGDSTATFKLPMVDEMEASASVNRPYIQEFEGKEYKWRLYVHTNVFKQIIQDTSAPIQARDIYLAMKSASADSNMLKGRSFVYSNTQIVATDKMPYGVHSSSGAEQTNTRRSIFVGQEAGAVGFGRGFSDGKETLAGFKFTQDETDVQQWKRIGIVAIWGVRKTVFNSIDHGVIVATTYVG